MKKKIVVMEYDADILFIVKHIFENQGYLVLDFSTEDGLLATIESEQPHAVVLDIVQPTVEGMALCKAIKATEQTRHIPVIALSTHVKIEDIKKVCADDVLAKPFSLDELIVVVQKQVAA